MIPPGKTTIEARELFTAVVKKHKEKAVSAAKNGKPASGFETSEGIRREWAAACKQPFVPREETPIPAPSMAEAQG